MSARTEGLAAGDGFDGQHAEQLHAVGNYEHFASAFLQGGSGGGRRLWRRAGCAADRRRRAVCMQVRGDAWLYFFGCGCRAAGAVHAGARHVRAVASSAAAQRPDLPQHAGDNQRQWHHQCDRDLPHAARPGAQAGRWRLWDTTGGLVPPCGERMAERSKRAPGHAMTGRSCPRWLAAHRAVQPLRSTRGLAVPLPMRADAGAVQQQTLAHRLGAQFTPHTPCPACNVRRCGCCAATTTTRFGPLTQIHSSWSGGQQQGQSRVRK